MKKFCIGIIVLFGLFSSCVTDSSQGPPPRPGVLKSKRTPREPVTPILTIDQEEIGQYLHVSSPRWEDQIIYFILVDRFDDGDPSNSDQGAGVFDPRQNRFYSGGDLKGILDNLDYIKGLGATAIWITPPVANQWWDGLVEYSGYHGYWGRHFKKVDEHYGSLEDYQMLSATLHKNGMYLIQDIVPNHTGNFFYYDGPYDPSDPRKNFTLNPQSLPSSAPEQELISQNNALLEEDFELGAYHWTPYIDDFNDPNKTKTYQLSDLDDLNTSNPLVRDLLRNSYNFWIDEVGVDGFRIDTVKYVEHDFWHDFHHSKDRTNPGVIPFAGSKGKGDFFTFGEAWIPGKPFQEGHDQQMAAYIGSKNKPQMSSVINFSLGEEIQGVFSGGRSTNRLSYRIESMFRNYPDPYRLVNFIDNHDMNRFLASANYQNLQSALVFLMTMPGIPVIYYGTEQEFTQTRAAMFADGFASGGQDHFNPESRGYRFLQKLIQLRKSSPAFSRGTIEVLTDASYGAGAFGYRRKYENEDFIVVFNTSRKNILLGNMSTGLEAGIKLEMVLGTDSTLQDMRTSQGGALSLMLPPYCAVVWKVRDDKVQPQETGLSLSIDNLREGAVLKGNTLLEGRASGTQRVRVFLNGDYNRGKVVPVENGVWQFPLEVEKMANGDHEILVQALGGPSGTWTLSPVIHFKVEVEYESLVTYEDPIGDDKGPGGNYSYPTHPSFLTQMDIERVEISRAGNNLKISITPAGPVSTVWAPQYGYDHVAYFIYLDIPGKPGVKVMPFQNSQVPDGMEWNYMLMQGGWMSFLYSHEGAKETSYGLGVQPAPSVQVDEEARRIDFVLTGEALGDLQTFSGMKIYLSTWDYDGLESALRLLEESPGEYIMGGGDYYSDPLIMDDTSIIVVP